MGLETVLNISDLVSTNPLVTDEVGAGDDHLRNIKVALKTDFPNFVTSTTGCTATQAELSNIAGVTGGTVTASKVVIVGSSSQVNQWVVDNITIDANTISSTNSNGNLILAPNGTGKVDVQGGFITSGTASLSGAGALPVTDSIVEWATTGVNAGTLADGVEGQHLFVILKTDGGNGTLTPTSRGGYSNITFADAGDSVHLLFTNSVWYVVGQGGLSTGPVVA